MNITRHPLWQAAILAMGFLAVVLWCLWQFQKNQSAAMNAARDLEACVNAASRIHTLRQRPSLAGLEQLQSTELSRRIEQATRSANIDPARSLLRIVPESPRRLGDSPYKEAPTQVSLRQVTMQQLIGFLYTLTPSDSGLQARSLRLSVPRQTDSSDDWEVEATITYLIYSPQSANTTNLGTP
jgi:HPt (histidine-containing phosphotransfer) domain-containing protein